MKMTKLTHTLVAASVLCTSGWALADDGPATTNISSSFSTSGLEGKPVTLGDVAGQPCGDSTLTQSTNPKEIVPGTVQCAAGAVTVENGLARTFALDADTSVCGVQFGVETNTGGAWDITINLYEGDITGPFGGLELRGSSTVTVPNATTAEFFVATFDPPVEFTAGENLVVEIFNPSRALDAGGDGGAMWPGSNGLGETGPGYIRSVDCGIADFATFASIGFPNVHLTIKVFAGEGAGCLGDLDGSGEVDGADLALLLGAWGTCDDPDDCPADLDGSGEVDGADLALLLGAWGECPGPPPPACGDFGTGDCCEANGSPYCNDADCCNLICDLDPFCCDTEWDSLCAETANAECETCQVPDICGPGAGDCCASNGTPGCEDIACCETVCAADPFCCDTTWDTLCADQAAALCGDLCGGGGGDSDCCVSNGTPGCDDPDCEAAVCAVDPFCCDTSWDQLCADQAADLCGDLCDGGGGGDVCGEGAGDCCAANGTPGCEDVECCETVCACDPFCCDTTWDAFCAGEGFEPGCGAALLCDICQPEPESNCCDPEAGQLGCEDLACEEAVCAEIAFCCTFEWDAECAALANEICEVCDSSGPPACEVNCPDGALDEGEACGTDTNGGCNATPPVFGAVACGDTICGTAWADAASRDTDFFEITVDATTNATAELVSQFPGVVAFFQITDPCTATFLGTFGHSDESCSVGTGTATLEPGLTYTLFVSPGLASGGGVFEGYPCGSGANDYTVTLSCE